MRTFKSFTREDVKEPVQPWDPRSEGEQRFKHMHNPINHKNLVPGVTDQEHVFNGGDRRYDPPTASYEKGADETAYDKGLTTEAKMSRSQKSAAVRKFFSHDKEAGEKVLAQGSKERGENKAFASAKKEIKSAMKKEDVDHVDEANLPPHLAKMFNKKGDFKDPKKHAIYKGFQDKMAKRDLGVDAKDHKSEYGKMRAGMGVDDKATTRKIIGEKHLTPAEMKKREQIAKAMGRENPKMDMAKKMAIATAQAKKVAESVTLDEKVNSQAFVKKYRENEEDNMHSDNVVHLAKHFGNSSDQKQALEIKQQHDKEGSLSRELSAKRNALHDKLWKKAEPHFDKVDKMKAYRAEEVEHLDELKRTTLASYVRKASHDVATKSAATGRYADRANKVRDEVKKGDYSNYQQGKKDDATADKMFDKSWKRRKGIDTAVSKLAHTAKVNANEEVEQIDEISSSTLVSYSQKAHQQVKGNQPSDPDKLRKRTNREKGIKLAFNKHYQFRTKVPATVSTNEELELDEAKKTGAVLKNIKDRLAQMKKRDAMTKASDTKTQTQKTFPNVKHFTPAGHPDWEKHGIKNIPTQKESLELDEAKRGRPRKDGSTKPAGSDDEEGGREHIIIQLRKSENLRGSEKHVEFNDNSRHVLNPAHVKKALDMHSGMKPSEKETFEKRLASSHASFTSAVKGEPAPKPKPKISLGGKVHEMRDPSTTRADKGAESVETVRDADGVLRVVKRKGVSKGTVSIGEAKDLNAKNVKVAVKHDCATHVEHAQWGVGNCIPEMHTIEEIFEGVGYVTHYDIMFEHGIEQNVPVESLRILASEEHGHTPKKTMKEALKGNQHRIDANHNNKIDAQDFKILKGKFKKFSKKKMNEAEEMTAATVKAAADTQYAKGQVSKENMQQDSINKMKTDPLASKESVTLPPTQGNKPIGGDTVDAARVGGKYSMEEERLENLFNSLSEENQEKFAAMLETEEGLEQLLDFAEKQGF